MKKKDKIQMIPNLDPNSSPLHSGVTLGEGVESGFTALYKRPESELKEVKVESFDSIKELLECEKIATINLFGLKIFLDYNNYDNNLPLNIKVGDIKLYGPAVFAKMNPDLQDLGPEDIAFVKDWINGEKK